MASLLRQVATHRCAFDPLQLPRDSPQAARTKGSPVHPENSEAQLRLLGLQRHKALDFNASTRAAKSPVISPAIATAAIAASGSWAAQAFQQFKQKTEESQGLQWHWKWQQRCGDLCVSSLHGIRGETSHFRTTYQRLSALYLCALPQHHTHTHTQQTETSLDPTSWQGARSDDSSMDPLSISLQERISSEGQQNLARQRGSLAFTWEAAINSTLRVSSHAA